MRNNVNEHVFYEGSAFITTACYTNRNHPLKNGLVSYSFLLDAQLTAIKM
jgi:hypothetical protein